ncbi:MAG TPA: MDR family MFS transporter [Nocardioidaceae bacterium]|nr:MDR family MFS transporter [Nocardioidaceae bacterium]
MTPDKDGYLSHRQILVVLGGLLTGMFLSALDQSIVGTALPRITSDLGGLDKLSWVVTAYLLTATASTPLWGKISDLYGRRPLFQIAILIFIFGSLLAGFAQNIEQLIAFRAVQGLGGGGLMALAIATIGDVVPPRERARYQGYIAAVFGTASVLGPVLGGWFADGPGWEWIFFINVPIGAVALVVTSAALKMKHVRREHSIDYLGAAILVASVSAILLYTAWAGGEFGWGAWDALVYLVSGLGLAVVFVFVERRATEPILPLALFSNPIFRVSAGFGFLVAMAMFGAMVFLPIYLQVVDGMSPTESGLAMIPMVVGLFGASISAGQYMSRTGHYKRLPPSGAAVTIVGLVLLSSMGTDTPYWFAGLAMFVMGAGLGMTMQVLIVAVQNSVDRSDMGVATSSIQFFRQMGGAFGTALFGAVMSHQLTHHLASGAAPASGDLANNVERIKELPEPMHGIVTGAFANSLQDVFIVAIPLVVVALGIGLLLKEIPLAVRQQPSDAVTDAVDAEAAVTAAK